MYFDVVIKVKTFLILFRLAPAILCLEQGWSWITDLTKETSMHKSIICISNCTFLNERNKYVLLFSCTVKKVKLAVRAVPSFEQCTVCTHVYDMTYHGFTRKKNPM